jgi:hypothetical protein
VRARTLLAGGVVAGPFYLLLALGQALVREGFDITRHAVSLLALGPGGWVQVLNFVATGALVLACAAGLRAVLRGGRGGTWGPLLLGIYGAALIASGLLPADAGFGFPPGTPPGPPEAMTSVGTLHFAAGGLGFMALVAACLVFARRQFAHGERGQGAFSVLTAVGFLASFMGIASGPPRPATVIGLWLGLTLTWAWLAILAWRAREYAAGLAGEGLPRPAAARSTAAGLRR